MIEYLPYCKQYTSSSCEKLQMTELQTVIQTYITYLYNTIVSSDRSKGHPPWAKLDLPLVVMACSSTIEYLPCCIEEILLNL